MYDRKMVRLYDGYFTAGKKLNIFSLCGITVAKYPQKQKTSNASLKITH